MNTPADHAEAAEHARHADDALLRIEGEQYAEAYLTRLHAGTATPDDLATLLAFLTGELLHGACRVIEKALRGRHA